MDKFGVGSILNSPSFTKKENHQGKTLSGEFKVTTPENPLL